MTSNWGSFYSSLLAKFKKKLLLSESMPFVLKRLPEHRREYHSTGGVYKRQTSRFIRALGDLHVDQYTPEMVQLWYDQEASREKAGGGKLSQSSLNTGYYSLKGYFAHLEEMGHLKSNPFQFKPPKVQKKVEPSKRANPTDISEMIASSDSSRNKAILMIAFDSGSRMNEMRMMKISTTYIDSFYIKEGKPVVLESGQSPPDGFDRFYAGTSLITFEKQRQGYVKFRHDACLALISWIKARPNPKPEYDDFVWISNHRRVMSHSAFYRVYKKAGDRVGAEISYPTGFRNLKAYNLRKSGATVQAAATVMNNSYLVMHNIYQTFNRQDQLQEYLSLNDDELPKSSLL